MAVTITSPTSQLINRTNGVTIAWTPEYPQSGYEILYRVKGTESWSTFGKVTSGATSVALDMSKLNDFIEYHYRVVCYSDNSSNDNNATIYTGNDSSAAYSLILVPDQKAMLKVKGSSGMVEVPLYSEVDDFPTLRVKLSNSIVKAPIVNKNSALASNFLVKTPSGIGVLGSNKPNCEATGVGENTYLSKDTKYSYYYTSAFTTTKYYYGYDYMATWFYGYYTYAVSVYMMVNYYRYDTNGRAYAAGKHPEFSHTYQATESYAVPAYDLETYQYKGSYSYVTTTGGTGYTYNTSYITV